MRGNRSKKATSLSAREVLNLWLAKMYARARTIRCTRFKTVWLPSKASVKPVLTGVSPQESWLRFDKAMPIESKKANKATGEREKRRILCPSCTPHMCKDRFSCLCLGG